MLGTMLSLVNGELKLGLWYWQGDQPLDWSSARHLLAAADWLLDGGIVLDFATAVRPLDLSSSQLCNSCLTARVKLSTLRQLTHRLTSLRKRKNEPQSIVCNAIRGNCMEANEIEWNGTLNWITTVWGCPAWRRSVWFVILYSVCQAVSRLLQLP